MNSWWLRKKPSMRPRWGAQINDGCCKSLICKESGNHAFRFPRSKKPRMDFLRPYQQLELGKCAVAIKAMFFTTRSSLTTGMWLTGDTEEKEETWDPGEPTVSIKATLFTTEENENTEKSWTRINQRFLFKRCFFTQRSQRSQRKP